MTERSPRCGIKTNKQKKQSHIYDISYSKPESCNLDTNKSITRKFPEAIYILCFVFFIMTNSGDQFI